MRLNTLWLLMPLFVLLCTTSHAQTQEAIGNNPFQEASGNENPFGDATPGSGNSFEIESQPNDTAAQDPFSPIQEAGSGSSNSSTQTSNPFDNPVVEKKQTANPFDNPLVEKKQTQDESGSGSPFGIEPLTQENNTGSFGSGRKDPSPFDSSQAIQETANPFGEREVVPEVEMVEVPRNTEPEESFEEKFWTYLKSNAYENWAPVPNTQGDFYVGSSPHGAFLKMYLNRIAVGNTAGLPAGSIIVKENYSVDRSTLKAVTVMYRSKAYNPDAGDWYWVKFNPDGTVDRSSIETGSKPIAGKVTSCIECHSDAGGDDFIFFNDN